MDIILAIVCIALIGICSFLILRLFKQREEQSVIIARVQVYDAEINRLVSENDSLLLDLQSTRENLDIFQRRTSALEESARKDEQVLKGLKEDISLHEQKYEKLSAEHSTVLAQLAVARTKLEVLTTEKQKLEEETTLRFKSLAADVLRENTDALKLQHETRLTELLMPLRDNIEQFKRTFTESYEKESRERFALDKHIRELVSLNQNIGKEAQELARALRGNSKVQGDWGEMILEGILEKSGLQKGREFVIQESTQTEEGTRLRADVVVNYPDGRCAIIDSKVSLTDYIRSVNADSTEEQKQYLAAHAMSVRKHIDELKTKNYQDYIGNRKADFVMMFVPNEGAYIAAMQQDNSLWQYAYDNRVVVISPTHLISVMKLLEQLWQHDRQSRNAVEIARKAGSMYDKFVGFLTDLSKIRKALDAATLSYDESLKKLSTGKGSLIKSAITLKEMGAKVTRNLPEQFDQEDDPKNIIQEII